MPQGAKTLTYAAVFLDFSNALKLTIKTHYAMYINILHRNGAEFRKNCFLTLSGTFLCTNICFFTYFSIFFGIFFTLTLRKEKSQKMRIRMRYQNAASECMFWHIDIEPKCILTFARASDIIITYNYTPRGRGGALCIEILIKYERT